RHVGQRHVGDGGVERLHDGGQHDAEREQHDRPARGGRGHDHIPTKFSKSPSDRWRPVSISTCTLMPVRSGGASAGISTARRTGTRCPTLTPLPVAFWAGSTGNTVPAPGPRAVTGGVPSRAR